MKKISFVGPTNLFESFLNNFSQNYKITCFATKHLVNLSKKVNLITCEPKFYFRSFNKFQLSFPVYYKNLIRNLNSVESDLVIVTDIYRLFTWQVIFSNIHKKSEIWIYPETYTLSSNFIKKYIMLGLLKLLKLNSKKISKIITFTNQGKLFFEKYIPGVLVEVYSLPIDDKLFYPSKTKVFLKNSTLKILINSRFEKFKRYDILFKALNHIKKYTDFKFKLSICSRGNNNKEYINNLIQEYNLTNEISFLARVPLEEMRNYYLNTDVLVLPSFNEPIGMVVPEAMACGIPTISSDSVGANTYVKKNKTGLIFETDNYMDLVEKIIEMFNKHKLNSMSKNSVEEIKYNYLLKNFHKKFN